MRVIVIPVMVLILLGIGFADGAYAGTFLRSEDDPMPPPAEETVLGDMEFELQPGEHMIPMHGSKAVDYFRNLKFVEQEECPVNMIAMKDWYYYDENSGWNRIFPDYNDESADYSYDCRTKYRLELQVRIPKIVGYTTYSFANKATITIDGHTFTLDKVNEFDDSFSARFRCDDIYPRYIRVEGIEVVDSNMDDVLGDEDERSTVSYDPGKNVLTLDNAHLVFDEKSCAPSVTDEYQRAAMIFAVNTDLTINVEGENSIAPGKGDLTEEPYIEGISQAYTNDGPYKLNIEGDGSLSIDLSGEDSYYGSGEFLYGISGYTVNISGVELSINLHDAECGEGIAGLEELVIGGKADVRITDKKISKMIRGIFHGFDNAVTIKESSTFVAELSAPESVGIDTNSVVEFMDDSVVLLTAGKAAISAKGCNFTNYTDKSALVNGEASETGRAVWDGVSELNNSYKYVRIPGLKHVEAVPATDTESGNTEYFYDKLSDKYYSDAAGSSEIAKEDTIIEPTPEGPDGPTPEDPDDPKPVDPQPAPTPVVTPTAPAVPAEIQDLPVVKASKPAAAKKSVNVKWKKVSKKDQKKIQGIEIQIATDPDFIDIVKTALASKKKSSKKIKGLTSKQTYYVRIRSYKDAADGKHVSAWKTKKIKVK